MILLVVTKVAWGSSGWQTEMKGYINSMTAGETGRMFSHDQVFVRYMFRELVL